MSQIIYIGLKLIKIPAENRFQLISSHNAGISWQIIFDGSNETGEFFELGTKGKIVFAKTSNGKFLSVTEGRTWTKIR